MKQTIFITGASSGLGKATAKYFAEKGWNVAATMRTPGKETELTQYENVQIFKLDVTNISQTQQAVNDAIASFGKIDVVLNNAGMGVYGPLELATDETIDQQFAVNVKGVANVIRAFLPHFRKQKGGKFINVSSFMGITTAVPLGSLYNMSKFALEGLIEGLYYELKPFNISLHLIEPGGSTGNNFKDNIVWSKSDTIKVYDPLVEKLTAVMANPNPAFVDDIIVLVKAIERVAAGESKEFRTVIGQAGYNLMNMRNSMPIEQYLDNMYKTFLG